MNYSMMKGTRLKEVLQNTTPKPQRPISKGKKRSVLVNFISKLTSHFAQNPKHQDREEERERIPAGGCKLGVFKYHMSEMLIADVLLDNASLWQRMSTQVIVAAKAVDHLGLWCRSESVVYPTVPLICFDISSWASSLSSTESARYLVYTWLDHSPST